MSFLIREIIALENVEEINTDKIDELTKSLAYYLNTSPIGHKKKSRKKKDSVDHLELGEHEYYYISKSIIHNNTPCGCILTESYLSVFQLESPFRIFKRIPHNENIGIHRISSFLEDKEEETKFGVFLCCMSIENQKIFKFHFFVNTKKEEDVFLLKYQYVSFCGPKNNNFNFSEFKKSTNNQGLNKKARRVLCIINPTSGPGKKSVSVVNKICKPVLDLAHLEYTCVVTERPGHATEITRELDFMKYNEIISCGGDGTLHEIVQGLIQNPSIQNMELKKIPISIIPTGTGNSLSWEFGCQVSPIISSLICARGKTVSLDGVTIITPTERLMMILFFQYGLVADVDFGYKSLEWLGELKYVIGGGISCIKRPIYGVDVQYVPDENSTPQDPYIFPQNFGNSMFKEQIHVIKGNEKKKELPLHLLEHHFKKELENLRNSNSNKLITDKKKREEIEGEGELDDEEEYEEIDEAIVNSKVERIRENVYNFGVCNNRKLSVDFWASGRHNAGCGSVDIVWYGKELGIFGAICNSYKAKPTNLLDSGVINSKRIKAFYFQPVGEKKSVVDIDGEEKKTTKAMGEVHKQLFTFSHAEKPWKNCLED